MLALRRRLISDQRLGIIPIRIQKDLPRRDGQYDRYNLHPSVCSIYRDVDGRRYPLWYPLGSLPNLDHFIRCRDLPNGYPRSFDFIRQYLLG
jgi:hypothetical protein